MPNNLDEITATAPKNVEIASMRIPLQTLLNKTRKARESASHVGMSRRKPAHCPVWQSSALKHIENPRQRLRVKLRIHPDPSSVAKIDLDQSNPGGRHGPHSSFASSEPESAASIRTGVKHTPAFSTVRACRRQVNTTLAATPLRRAASVTFAPRRQRFLDAPHLVVMRPPPSSLDPA